ncbi:TPA: hypothetical protein ACX6NP_003964 [Photobacterium damselae]
MFNHFLAQYREENNLTQQDMVDQLASYHPSFNKLDTVTLSRWENEKTLPPLKKQFLVFDYINKLCEFTTAYTPSIKDQYPLLESYINNKFENSNIIISDILNTNNCHFTKTNNDPYLNIERFVSDYFQNEFVSDFVLRENIETVSWNKNNQLEACLIYTSPIKEHNNDNMIFMGVFAKNRTSFELIYRELYELILESNVENIIMYSFDDNGYKLFKKLGGEIIKITRISKDIIKYIFKFNRIDFLSNKDIFFYYKSLK